MLQLRKRRKVNLDNKYLLQDFVLLLLYEGKYIPPLRNNYATLIITEPKDDLLSSENYLITNNDKNEIWQMYRPEGHVISNNNDDDTK